MTRLLRAILRWLRFLPPPHYTEPPLTDAERDRRLAKLIREIDQ